MTESATESVPVQPGTRLGQFCKFAGLLDSGAEAKAWIAEGMVRVNGEVDTRRGRQLAAGDLVEVVDDGQVLRAAVVEIA